jgi:hypothetical protein
MPHPRLLIVPLAALACLAPLAHAGSDPYGDALAGYKGELKRDTPDVINSDFYGTLANSQARRALAGADGSSSDLVAGDSRSGTARNRDPRASSGVNVASPQIYGNVHGNVVVVVQRGAVRGSITSVQR